MKSGLFSRLKDKIAGLNPREKWLLGIAGMIVLFLLMDQIVVSPFSNYKDQLTLTTREKKQQLADIKNYLNHKELQKDLFRGKASDFLSIFMQAAKDSGLGPVQLKKTDNSAKEISVQFECDGNIQKILDFILKMENMDFTVLFQKADLLLIKGSDYHLEGQIQVMKE